MLWKKRVNEREQTKEKRNLAFIPLFLILLCLLGGYGQRRDTTSIVRWVVIEPADEATYLASAVEVPPEEEETVSGNEIEGLESEVSAVFDKVNQVRAEAGLEELVWCDELAEAADIRAKEIQEAFSHTRPDGSEWWTVNREIIYGENLAKGYQDAESVMSAWMESSEHKDNILYAGFESIGIAVFEYDGKWYWAQEFGY